MITARDNGGPFVLENTFHAQGRPARHLRDAQDECCYVVEDEFLLEVGTERFRLRPGDVMLAPRRVPYV